MGLLAEITSEVSDPNLRIFRGPDESATLTLQVGATYREGDCDIASLNLSVPESYIVESFADPESSCELDASYRLRYEGVRYDLVTSVLNPGEERATLTASAFCGL